MKNKILKAIAWAVSLVWIVLACLIDSDSYHGFQWSLSGTVRSGY